MTGTVLQDLQRVIAGRKGSKITSIIKDKATDRRIGYRAILQLNAHEREKFVLTGFSYLPEPPETIGVMEKLMKIGVAEDRHILVYFHDRQFHHSMVFDALAFAESGEMHTKNDDRKKRKERWLNLPRDYACSLREYADGDATPRVELSQAEEAVADGSGGWFNV